jgi:ClpP class serine protease
VWAFVAEHAFSAGYALASQADRIILPRTGAVGSIGVVVMHADLSVQLSDAGVTVTLIHSGAHKVDGNPYAPLPDQVRARIQAEIDGIRTLFAETVAAGRGRRLTAGAALATEAECFRGAEAVAAGLADEISDPASAFAAFADVVNRRGLAQSAGPGRSPQSQLSKEKMMKPNLSTASEAPDPETGVDPAPVLPPAPAVAPAAAPAPASDGEAAAFATSLARAEAAELATIGAQATRLGVTIDVAEAVQKGIKPDALRASILNQLAARGDATAMTVVPAPKSAAPESPLLAAVKRAASAAKPA